MIWRDGVLPPGAPAFSPQLASTCTATPTASWGSGLRLLEMGGDPAQARIAFEQAATALEAVMARGNRLEADRHFHFVMAAASYHLAHLSARAFSLLTVIAETESFSPMEQALALLMRRDITALRTSGLHRHRLSLTKLLDRLSDAGGVQKASLTFSRVAAASHAASPQRPPGRGFCVRARRVGPPRGKWTGRGQPQGRPAPAAGPASAFASMAVQAAGRPRSSDRDRWRCAPGHCRCAPPRHRLAAHRLDEAPGQSPCLAIRRDAIAQDSTGELIASLPLTFRTPGSDRLDLTRETATARCG